MENNKTLGSKISSVVVVTAIAATVSLSGVLGENNFSLSEAFGYGSSNTGSTGNKTSFKVKESSAVSTGATKATTTTTDTKKETKTATAKPAVEKPAKTSTSEKRVEKTMGNKKYSLNNLMSDVSMNIAKPKYNSTIDVPFKDTKKSMYKSDIQRLYRNGIVAGTSNTTFEPNRAITRAEFLAIVLKAHGVDVSKKATSTAFTDLKVGDWKTNVVQAALESNVIAGDVRNGKKVFRPNDTISKIEALAILTSMRDIQLKEGYTHGYKDAAADWQNAVLSKVEYLGLEDKSEMFKPNSTVDRGAMAHYLVKTVELY